MDEANSINESFEQLLARGDAIIKNCRALMDENVRLRKEVESRKEINDALARYGISASGLDAASALDGKLTLLDTIENLMDEHQIENSDDLAFVLKNYDKFKGIASDLGCIQNCDPDELRGKVEDLKKNTEPADYQVLKDFKGEMDAIHEEFDIPRDVNELRKTLEYAKSIKEIIEEKTDMNFSLSNALQNLSDLLDDYNTYEEACNSHTIDPDELDGKLDDYDAMDMACSDHGVEPKDLDDALNEWEDNDKYKNGFEELSEFVDKVKDAVDDIPSTDVEDYK